MLITNAELDGGLITNVRLAGDHIADIAPNLQPNPGEPILNAARHAVLPGLHDHHIHLYATAAAKSSVACGPPHDATTLRAALRVAPGNSWVRGVGYHHTVAGDIDRHWIDHAQPNRPVRIQHRTGRLWIFNSAALDALRLAGGDAARFEQLGGRFTGRLYDGDAWLAARLAASPPNLADVSRALAAHGVTALTDASPGNDAATAKQFYDAQQAGDLLQDIYLMGRIGAGGITTQTFVAALAAKLHLHDNALPDPDDIIALTQAAHAQNLGLAVHVVTEADLVFTLAILEAAGSHPADRIEHASLVPDHLLPRIADLGITIVTQPHFIAERGDAYHLAFPGPEREMLYRGASFLQHGIALGGGSDSPYGAINPWASMQASINRRSLHGIVLGAAEALSPEQALALYTTPASAPGGAPRRIAVGGKADLCILDRSWVSARQNLGDVRVVACFASGRLIYSS